MKEDKWHETQGLKYKGCHFSITIDDVRYKNSETMESKQILFDRNKNEGRELFKNKNYVEAIKKYKNIINITTGNDKKKFSVEEQEKLL